MDTRKVAVLGAGNGNLRSTISNILEKERGVEIVNIDNIENNKEIVENSDLIVEQKQINSQFMTQEPYLIRNYRDTYDQIYLNNTKIKRTDEQRLKEYGIDSLDRLLEECILISQKQSKLPRSIRDIIIRTSIEAFKELNLKAEEIKKESLENNTKENDEQE